MAWKMEPGTCLICEQPKGSTFFHSAVNGPVCSWCYQRKLQPCYPCRFCRRIRPATVRLSPEEGICASCYATHVYRGRCGACGQRGRIAAQTESGPWCVNCYQRNHVERCRFCGEVRRVHVRLESGEAVCDRCNRSKLQPRWCCSECGTRSDQRRYRNRAGRAVCQRCYLARTKRKEPCSDCGRRAAPVRRTDSGAPVCERCASKLRKRDECGVCGRWRPVAIRRDADGRAVCDYCYQTRVKPKEVCAECGRLRPTHKRLADGSSLCNACNKRRLAQRRNRSRRQ